MSDTPFKALDHDFREGMRTRIKAAELIDKLNNYVLNPVAYPMSPTQCKTALGLLSYVLPQLKAVEHTKVPSREPTRQELIERLSELQPRAASQFERHAADGTGAVDGATEVHH